MRKHEEGFALVLMMVVLAGGGALFVSALSTQRTARPLERSVEAQRQVEELADRAADYYLRVGAFPASLAALGTAGLLPVDGFWTADPFGGGADLGYRVTGRPATLEVRSVGPDGRGNTADDLVATRSAATLGRIWTARRLTALRTSFFLSPLMAGTLAAPDRALLADATRRYRAALRAWPSATAAERTQLEADMQRAETDVIAVRTGNLLPALPTSVAGTGGLLDRIGQPQTMATDGFGQTFSIDPVLGVRCDGVDGVGGTDDDF